MPASTRLMRAVTFAFATVPGLALAAQLDYSLYAGIEHSNNIDLSNQDPISESVLVPGLNFTFAQQGATFQANVAGTVEYRDYLGGKFDNQTQTQLAGQANWTVLPQRLDFSVEDYAAVQPVDSLASNAPDNQQQTNVLALGPTLHMRFGNALRGQVELRYINSYASKVDDFDSSRGAAAVRLFRDINATDQLSANVETQHVDFRNGAATDYVRNEAYLAYDSKLARFDINAVLGWSQLDFDHAQDESNPLVRVALEWRATPRSTFSLAGALQYADAAQGMLPSQGEAVINAADGISIGNSVVDSQVYKERSLFAAYTLRTERMTLSVAPTYRKLHYLIDSTLDQIGRGGGINFSYRLRPMLTLTALATGERLTYQTLNRQDKTVRFGLDLSRQWTQHWSAHVSVDRQRRTSDVTEQSYRETRIFFGVVFDR